MRAIINPKDINSKMKNLAYYLIGITAITCSTTFGQERQLTGIVRVPMAH